MAASRDDETNGQDPGGGGGGGGLGGGSSGGGRSPREDTPPAPCAAFCGPRSCATLPPSLSPQQQHSPPQQQAPVSTEPKRRRFWGLRGIVKMFRRRVRRRADDSASPQPPQPTLRARSTSELAVDIQHSRNSGPYNQGLSVSHDSVFSPDTSTDSHHSHANPPALAIATRGVNMAELKAVLRNRRRGEDSGSGDDDPGLPRSPPTSPTTLDVLNHGLKSCSRATQSTCSDGSLLSMGSSENDEDSLGIGSHHSSKVSLLEGRHQVVDNEPVAGAVPLSHQAAHHKISVRPRRTHGAPRSRRSAQIAGQMSLPATPEVNEEANNKATPPKSTSISAATNATPDTTLSPPETPVIQPVIDDQIKAEPSADADSREPEKKDEPLLQRIFGSVRSGRRRSRGSGDESRENSVSPMRRGADQRTSREKRRDSSGSRFPILGRASAKSRQESHPLPPSGKAREPSRERSKQETPPSPPQTPRSASVEGRLESTTPTPQNIFRMSSYEDRSSRPTEGVRKVKSFREVQSNNYEIQSKITSTSTNNEEISETSFRKTSSAESLDMDTKTSSSRTISSSGVTDISVSSHRSADSLTNTSLPGVFIRPQSQNQYKVFKHKNHDQQLVTQQETLGGQDVNSGPLSLDSSITLQSREPEDFLRKASSVSHVGYSVESSRAVVAKEKEQMESGSRRVSDVKPASRPVSIEEKSDIWNREIKKYPGNAVPAIPCETEGASKQKIPDETEADTESLRRRSLKKEPSIKLLLSRDPEPSPVPEFMRIQLNKVENKGHSIIYDTDTEKQIKTDITSTLNTSLQADNDLNTSVNVRENPLEGIHNTKVEPSHIIIESKSDKSYLKKSNSRAGKGSKREVSPSGSTLEKKDQDSGVEGSSPEPTIDRVVLRKPLVSERAPVMERASSVSQTTPSPTKTDQPELYKVFARRSFKVKDVDKEKFQYIDSDDENIEASSEISEVMVISSRPPDPALSSLTSSSPSSSVITSAPQPSLVQGLQKSSINAISFNKKSVGNPTLSFCPPPLTNVSSPAQTSLSQKPNILILSSNSSTVPVSTFSSVNTPPVSIPPTSTVSSKASVSPVQASIRPGNVTSEVGTASDVTSTAPAQQSGGITSKIINNRLSSMSPAGTANDNSGSGNELEANVAPTSTSPMPKTSRSGSGIIWPPRTQQDEETPPQLQVSQSRKLSSSLSISSEVEVNRTPSKGDNKQDPVEISPLDIGAARRRFMIGVKECQIISTPQAQNLPASAATPASTAQSTSSPQAASKIGTSVTEARNSTPSFTITVRTQPVPSEQMTGDVSEANMSSDLNSSTSSISSTQKSEQGTPTQATDDWRVLVRQRREGRLKQTKTPDAEKIIIETRPPVSRNSKVLEMANNFQKLQVA